MRVTGRGLRRPARVITVLLIIGLGLSIAAAYAGIEPLLTYKDAVRDKITAVATQYKPNSEPEYPRTRKFEGTHTTTIPLLGTEQTLTFKGDTVVVAGDLIGTSTFRYIATMESEAEGVLEFIGITTGEVSMMQFTYLEESDCIILYPSKGDPEVVYCR